MRLTAAELELADWAIDPMGAYWSDVVEDEDEDEPEDLPRTEGTGLHLASAS